MRGLDKRVSCAPRGSTKQSKNLHRGKCKCLQISLALCVERALTHILIFSANTSPDWATKSSLLVFSEVVGKSCEALLPGKHPGFRGTGNVAPDPN